MFLAPEAPFPPQGGGALRSGSLLTYLACRYAVDVVAFRQPGDAEPCFPAGMARRVEVLELPRHERSGASRLLRNAGRLLRRVPPLVDRFSGFSEQVARFVAGQHYDLGVVEHFWCAPYWPVLAPVCQRTVLNLHNIESALHATCARTEPFPDAWAHGVFRSASRKLERQWFPRYSLLLAPSKPDAARVQEIAPAAHVRIYPNAIPAVPAPERREEDAIVFSGNLGYHPNVAAVRYFRREIWPKLSQQWPGLVWRLVGRNASAVGKYTTGDRRIEVIGAVDDAVAELARAKVAIVPLLAGSGTRLKIVEAWAAGVPVVSTSLGAEGLPARDGENLLLADSADGFAETVSRLLGSAELRRHIGTAGRRVFETGFTWEVAWSVLDF